MLKLIGLVLVFIFFLNAVESKDTRKTKGNPNWFWNYCSKRNKCQAGEGDCDVDLDCEGDLKCGDDNCNGFLHKNADCCYDPDHVEKCMYVCKYVVLLYLGPSLNHIDDKGVGNKTTVGRMRSE